MAVAYQFGQVSVLDDGSVHTPAGSSWLAATEIEYRGSTPIVRSGGNWSVGMVIISCIVALFTCGLGLLLLFLSRSERTYTAVLDTVRVAGPGYVFIAQGPGGAAFTSWASSWRAQLVEYQRWELQVESYQQTRALETAPTAELEFQLRETIIEPRDSSA
ncbi:MAG: hypothetical protein Q8P61_06580 [Candidatus Nanopelagicales bacterium]|nr:hypothetical protein [Candidatus Nanopelagicales bacterium]